MDLSPHFSLEEMVLSNEAVRRGISNNPNESHITALRELCVNVLEPLREEVGPIHVSSGFRNKRVNELVGGSERSQHCRGEAADIVARSMTAYALCRKIVEMKLPFDQLIYEFGSWAHVSYAAGRKPRKSILTARRNRHTGAVEYLQGIV